MICCSFLLAEALQIEVYEYKLIVCCLRGPVCFVVASTCAVGDKAVREVKIVLIIK